LGFKKNELPHRKQLHHELKFRGKKPGKLIIKQKSKIVFQREFDFLLGEKAGRGAYFKVDSSLRWNDKEENWRLYRLKSSSIPLYKGDEVIWYRSQSINNS
jgi:hypothetical protein